MTKILKPFYIETRQQALNAYALSALNVPLSVLLPTAEKVSDTEDLLANARIDATLMTNAPCSKPNVVCVSTHTTSGINYRDKGLPGTTYKSGDVVTAPDGKTYMCTDDKCTLTLFAANSKEQQMKKGIKPRGRDRLVFTYTNGATYTVRGLMSAEFNKSSMAINYRTRKVDLEGHVHEETVTRYVTNEISTVVLEHASGWNRILLDLRTNSDKLKVVEQPTRNKRSREDWEALEAQKAKDSVKQARIAELQKELALLSK